MVVADRDILPGLLINRQGENVRASALGLIERASYPDIRLFHKLNELQGFRGPGMSTHPALRPFIESSDILNQTAQIRRTLEGIGTIRLGMTDSIVILDGVQTPLTFVKATPVETGTLDNMSNLFWVRDAAFIADALMKEKDPSTREQGVRQLRGLLKCMDTKSQRQRFQHVIENHGNVVPEDHPAIRFLVSNTEGVVKLDIDEEWGHNQEAWQILAFKAIDAYDKKLIDKESLMKHATFFRSIPDFLAATDYLNRESKGSWEEINAKGRLSTIAWEWPLLVKLLQHKELFGFNTDTQSKMKSLIESGAQAIIERFPHESASLHHGQGDPAYRKADAALLYLGLAEVPELLSQLGDRGLKAVDFSKNPYIQEKMAQGLKPIDAMYGVLFETVDKLKDPVTGGIARYKRDSYQPSLFWTNEVWNPLIAKEGLWSNPIYKDDPGVIHFVVREAMLEEANRSITGRSFTEASWTHPNFQILTIARRLSASADNPEAASMYQQVATDSLRRGLRMITFNDFTLMPQQEGIGIVRMSDGIAPECYIQNDLGDQVVTQVGPWHLNWAIATLREALAYAA